MGKKLCRGKGRVQCWRASPNHRKIKNPIMLVGIFGILGPRANPQHIRLIWIFGLVLGLCFGALGCQRVGGSTPSWASGPLGLVGGLVSGLVGVLVLAKYWYRMLSKSWSMLAKPWSRETRQTKCWPYTHQNLITWWPDIDQEGWTKTLNHRSSSKP